MLQSIFKGAGRRRGPSSATDASEEPQPEHEAGELVPSARTSASGTEDNPSETRE